MSPPLVRDLAQVVADLELRLAALEATAAQTARDIAQLRELIARRTRRRV